MLLRLGARGCAAAVGIFGCLLVGRSCSIPAMPTKNADARREASNIPADRRGGRRSFSGPCWVKAFNTGAFKVLEREAHRAGDRVGLAQ